MTLSKLKWLLASLALVSCLGALAQDRPDPEQLRSEARELRQKARDLRANGDREEAQRLALKARNLLRQAEEGSSNRTEPNVRPSDQRRDLAPDGDRVRPERRDRDEPRSLDRTDRSPRPRERLRGDAPGERPRGRAEGDLRDGGLRERLGPFGGAPFNLATRRYHMEKAIKHLRLAGLDEEADRLEQHMRDAMRHLRERRQEWLLDRRPGRPRPERPADREPRERSGDRDSREGADQK